MVTEAKSITQGNISDCIFRVQSKKPCIFIKEYVNIVLEDELKPAPKVFGVNTKANTIRLEYWLWTKGLERIALTIM